MSAAIEIDAGAQLSLVCDRLGETVAALKALQKRPVAVKMQSAALAGAAGVVGQYGNGDGPPGGMTWQIRRISIGPARGQETAITTPGTFIMYVDAEEIFRTTTVPNMIPFSHAQLTVRYPSRITYEWVAGTVGVTLIASGQAVQQPSSVDYQA